MTPADLLDRRVPDLIGTDDLAPVLGAEIDWLAGRTGAWTDGDRPAQPGVRARALVQAGRADEARLQLGVDDLGVGSTQGWVAGAWAVSRTGPTEVADRLLKQRPATPGPADPAGPGEVGQGGFLFEGDVPLGPLALSIGLLELAQGNHRAAIDQLAEAVSTADARGPAWGARARLELARALSAGSGLDHDETALRSGRRALISAQTFFDASGYSHLGLATARLAAPPDGAELATLDGVAAPWLGHLVPGAPWTIGFGVAPPEHLRASKGLAVLRALVRRSGEQVAAMELDRVEVAEFSAALGTAADPNRDGMVALIDEGATVEELRRRLFDDRTRSRVSKLVRRTIDRISGVHPLLGRHLSRSIHTGHFCRYEDAMGVAWRLGDRDLRR